MKTNSSRLVVVIDRRMDYLVCCLFFRCLEQADLPDFDAGVRDLWRKNAAKCDGFEKRTKVLISSKLNQSQYRRGGLRLRKGISETMDVLRITKEFTFEMAHALYGYDGKCANIHGHSYHLSVTVSGSPVTDERSPKLGMVMDFGDLKRIVKEEVLDVFDHALVLSDADPLAHNLPEGRAFGRLVKTSYQPTCENLLIDFVARIGRRVPAPVRLHSIHLRETPASHAAWFVEDN